MALNSAWVWLPVPAGARGSVWVKLESSPSGARAGVATAGLGGAGAAWCPSSSQTVITLSACLLLFVGLFRRPGPVLATSYSPTWLSFVTRTKGLPCPFGDGGKGGLTRVASLTATTSAQCQGGRAGTHSPRVRTRPTRLPFPFSFFSGLYGFLL